jgi:hypothetical protein
LGSSSNNDEPRNTTPSFEILSCDGAFGFVGTYEPDDEPHNGNTVYVQVKTIGLQHCAYRDDDSWVFRDVKISEPDGKRIIATARVSTKPDAYHEAEEVPSRIEDCGGWIDCASGTTVTIDFAAITPSAARPEAASALVAVSTGQADSSSRKSAEDGDAHRSEGTPDPLLPELAAFAFESLPNAPSKYKDEPFIAPRVRRIRTKSNGSQADRDRHENEKQKRASANKALEERHREKNSARKMKHTKGAVETLSAACAVCPQVAWEKWCAES